jgi:uncharacterized protein (DUF1778 family)
MATTKQRAAARRNIKKAAKAAKSKRTRFVMSDLRSLAPTQGR